MTSGCLLEVFKTRSQDHGLGVGHVLLQYGQTGVELAGKGIKFTLASGHPNPPYRSKPQGLAGKVAFRPCQSTPFNCWIPAVLATAGWYSVLSEGPLQLSYIVVSLLPTPV